MNTVNTEQRNIETEDLEADHSVHKVILKSVLTPEQVQEVESRKKQPTSLMTQLNGNSTGFHMLDDMVHPSTMAMLDENQNMILLAPVVGGC